MPMQKFTGKKFESIWRLASGKQEKAHGKMKWRLQVSDVPKMDLFGCAALNVALEQSVEPSEPK